MKLATTTVLTAHVPALPRPSADTLYRCAGLGIAAGVPALFWSGLTWATAQALGMPISAPALAGVAAAVGAVCLVGASLVMGDRD